MVVVVQIFSSPFSKVRLLEGSLLVWCLMCVLLFTVLLPFCLALVSSSVVAGNRLLQMRLTGPGPFSCESQFNNLGLC